MIKRVRLQRFKKFEDETFDLTGDTVILAGPNNSGKTTLLHAISAWNLALQRWGIESGGNVTRSRRISIVLDEFTALPLREMNLLWLNRHTARKVPGAKTPKAAPIYIEVTVLTPSGDEESLTIELMYANEKLVYVRPVDAPESPEVPSRWPLHAAGLKVVHVPAFSGIATQEPRHAPGIQNKFVGEGRAGEIVRNLLLDIWEKSNKTTTSGPWADLSRDVKRLFQYEILPPVFAEAQPYIVCDYRPRVSGGRSQRGARLDVANAGSGFHQVLLLLAFFYARPASVLLLDEPDAHLHFILQREIFDLLRHVARQRNCKLIVATHSEVLLAGSEPDQIVSFVGNAPQRLLTQQDKSALKSALKTLSSLDLLQANHVREVLYVEDESDYKLLREWATVLDHRASEFLSFPYVWRLEGRGNLGKAKEHFRCLRLAIPDIAGVCLVDRDGGTEAEVSDSPPGLKMVQWGRYEIENYLLRPESIDRFLDRQPIDLFNAQLAAQDKAVVVHEFETNFPSAVDYMSDLPALRDIKGSEFLVEMFKKTSCPLPKADLFMLAARMRPNEIHPDVVTVLDGIRDAMPRVRPMLAASESPEDQNGLEVAVGEEETGEVEE